MLTMERLVAHYRDAIRCKRSAEARVLRRLLREALPAPHQRVLAALEQLGEGVITDVVDATGLRPRKVSAVLVDLGNMGLIERGGEWERNRSHLIWRVRKERRRGIRRHSSALA